MRGVLGQLPRGENLSFASKLDSPFGLWSGNKKSKMAFGSKAQSCGESSIIELDVIPIHNSGWRKVRSGGRYNGGKCYTPR